MHFTGTVYRNPYWPTWPLLEITQGCTHNRCKFCTMYKGIPFRMQPLEDIEADAAEIASVMPDARTIQLLSANPLAMSFENLMPRQQIIKKHLPKLEHMYTATRVSDLKNKTVEQLKALRDIGLNEISLGVESGDDRTLQRINKGYSSTDILVPMSSLWIPSFFSTPISTGSPWVSQPARHMTLKPLCVLYLQMESLMDLAIT